MELYESKSSTGQRIKSSCSSILSIKTFHYSYIIDGTYAILASVDDTYLMRLSAFNFQGGQYKLMFEKQMGNLSEQLYNEANHEFWDNFQSHQKFPVAWKTWPYPAGPNEIKNFYLDDYGKLIPPYVPGREKWRIEVRYTIVGSDEIVGGYDAYGVLRNHNSLMNEG